jgi:site-specific recombinase XerD
MSSTVQIRPSAAVRPNALGEVADFWDAVERWLRTVAQNQDAGKTTTVETYRFHVAKLRWYCENVAQVDPSMWTASDAQNFVAFLTDFPAYAICAAGAVPGETGYSPFRKAPAPGSRTDIIRCVKALFSYVFRKGYLQFDPMEDVKGRKKRKLNVSKSIKLDLFDYLLEHLDKQPRATEEVFRLIARDRFALVALRELGLRSGELVGARMTDLSCVTDPKTGTTYWTHQVREELSKSGTERTIPVTTAALAALIAYRKAFGLPALPVEGEPYAMLLSPRTGYDYIGHPHVSRGNIPDAESRRFFGAWGAVTSRKTLFQIVKRRIAETVAALRTEGRAAEAQSIVSVSPHWLRHTFAKAKILSGADIRVLATTLGHASVETTMVYTQQDALDQILEYERNQSGSIARMNELKSD